VHGILGYKLSDIITIQDSRCTVHLHGLGDQRKH